MQDVTQALLLDSKYAAAYCYQRGLWSFENQQYEVAAADLTVTLLLDPGSRSARSLRTRALELRDQSFELDLSTRMPEQLGPAADQVEISPDLDSDNPDETQIREPAAETQPQIEIPEDEPSESTEDQEATGESIGATEEELKAEQRQVQERQRKDWERAQQVRLQFEEARRKDEEEKKAKAKQRKRRLTPEEAEEERQERWQKIKLYGSIAVLVLVAIYATWAWLIPLLPVRDPFTHLEAKAVYEAYSKDALAADELYSCKLVKITGTLFIEPRTKTQRFPRDFFEPEGEKSELRIECLFADADELAGAG